MMMRKRHYVIHVEKYEDAFNLSLDAAAKDFKELHSMQFKGAGATRELVDDEVVFKNGFTFQATGFLDE